MEVDEESEGGPRAALGRRAFCRAALVAAAAGASAPRAAAGLLVPRSANPIGRVGENGRPVVLMSDPHIHADPGKRFWGADLSANLARAVDRVVGGPRPAAVFFGGDTAVDRGRAEDYRQFGRLVRPLLDRRVPTHAVLGNHDDRLAFHDAFPGAFSPDGYPLRRHVERVERSDADWYLLDSLRLTDETPGSLGDAQLAWLTASLDRRPHRRALVLVHHPPGKASSPGRSRVGLADGVALLTALTARPQVKAVFHGHLHRFDAWTQHGLHVVGLPATSYTFGRGESSGYAEARLTHDTLRVTRRALEPGGRGDGDRFELPLRG